MVPRGPNAEKYHSPSLNGRERGAIIAVSIVAGILAIIIGVLVYVYRKQVQMSKRNEYDLNHPELSEFNHPELDMTTAKENMKNEKSKGYIENKTKVVKFSG